MLQLTPNILFDVRTLQRPQLVIVNFMCLFLHKQHGRCRLHYEKKANNGSVHGFRLYTLLRADARNRQNTNFR